MQRLPFIRAILFSCLVAAAPAPAADPAPPATFPVTIKVDASPGGTPLPPIWRFFGADEPNYAYMKDGEKLLGELGDLGKVHTNQVYFRAHHLLTSGDGAYALKFGSTSAYKEDHLGRPSYDWTINDRIFDTYLKHGVKPYAQIGFMPEALSTHPEKYPHQPPVDQRVDPAAGMAYPPKDYVKWGDLVYEWTRHCVTRYGQAEVEQWYWEVWNEPNIMYWHGTPEEYFKLYDYAVDGVRRALPTARVGGPETAGGPGGRFLFLFLTHCSTGTNYATGKIGSPLDFVSFHAKGSPAFTNGHVRMGLANQLRNMHEACRVIAKFPQFVRLPIVIGESDPEGCAACRDPQDAYRNGTMYSSYTAASFPRAVELAARDGVNLEGALTWAFEFEDQPPFAGFRQLASAGIDLPVLNVFRLFSHLQGRQLKVTSSAGLSLDEIRQHSVREQPDVSAWACADGRTVRVLLWHYHDDDVPGPAAAIQLELRALPGKSGPATLRQYRVDADHANAYQAWLRLGSPYPLSPEQFKTLEQTGKLTAAGPLQTLTVADHTVQLPVELPRQGVALLELELP